MFRVPALCIAAVLTFAAAPAALAADGDPAAGQDVFKKCMACHTVEAGRNRIGPSLHGVFERAAGTVDKFNYSKAMKESGLVWDAVTLDSYLADPRGFIPGNRMVFPGLKDAQERADVIAFLKANSP